MASIGNPYTRITFFHEFQVKADIHSPGEQEESYKFLELILISNKVFGLFHNLNL